MRNFKLLFSALFVVQTLTAQLTLNECRQKARKNYPLIQQLDLIEKSAGYNLSNASKAFLPQINVSLKATYQSDAIDMTLPLPAGPVSLHQSKDQYQAAVEVNQLLWDGGITTARKKLVASGAEVDRQKLEVELYTLNDRINQLFIGSLLLREQAAQLDLLQNELSTNLQRLQAARVNGIVSAADVDAFKVEMLSVDQRKTELMATRRSYASMLSTLLGEPVDENTPLQKPASTLNASNDFSNRPEMRLFETQKRVLTDQNKLENSSLMPKLGLFLQGGYGRPGLNMLSDEFAPFYIGGARLTWSLASLYSHKNNQSGIENTQKMLESSEKTFVLNTKMKQSQQQIELDKLKALLRTDDEVLQLRTGIKEACRTRLTNGVATATDLLREINAESNARQQKSLHELQLLLQIETLNYTTNQ